MLGPSKLLTCDTIQSTAVLPNSALQNITHPSHPNVMHFTDHKFVDEHQVQIAGRPPLYICKHVTVLKF